MNNICDRKFTFKYTDTTGEYSIYTIYEGHEIMFHVSTLLPYAKDSKQQDVEHDQEPDFTPSSARSQFQHIFALVTYNKIENSYKLRIYSEQSVPPFGPSLPTPPIFSNHQEFREFLLVKLINGEKAAFNNTVFGKRKKRTIEAIIKTIHSSYEKDGLKSKPSTGAVGFESITDAFISGNRKKEEQRKSEFLKIGQTIIKGDAPTSQITTGLIKREVWEPQLFLQSFHSSIICSDSWNDWLVVGTNDGVFVLDEAIPWDVKEIFDKTVVPKQLDICESYGLMILLLDKGRIYVFRLTDFNQVIIDSSVDHSLIKTKIHLKDNRLECISNSCQLYAISKQFSSRLNCFQIAAVCGKKITLAYLKYHHIFSHSTNICGTCSSNTTIFAQNFTPENEVANLFKFKKEINCSDIPQLINLIESTTSNETFILVAYKNKCELIDDFNGDCLKQFHFNQLSTIRSIIELYDSDQLEFLITYNYTSEFLKLEQQSPQVSNQANKTNYNFQWNSEPNFVLCAFPYVIGFANQSIEIRLLVNGNLVNSITMSNIKILACKKDVYFSVDHEEYPKNELNEKNVIPLVSNHNDDQISPPGTPPPHSVPDIYSGSSSIHPNILNNLNSSPNKRQQCTIYKISLDFLLHTNTKTTDKFQFSQLCEDSKRTIQREMNNFGPFMMIDPDDTRLSVYHKIITPNLSSEDIISNNQIEAQITDETTTNSNVL